ncbi:hypothetical protein SteCoe_20851 [Stentor coeruleus]|uniref:Uncharacterized protein n=1 Tax=Stentor coeruleus TaxID=5963 RepID=A0A1R2BQU2_9CILI|nr:hypothetical protein SteCoe_20851 [Stentor coeruleus]
MSKSQTTDINALLPSLTLKPSTYSKTITPCYNTTDSIYETEHKNFLSRLKTPDDHPKPIKLRIPCTPSIQFPNPHEKMYGKEDIFLNPTALYLSRKPLSFHRNGRASSQLAERTVSFTPSLDDTRKKFRKKRNYRKSVNLSLDSRLIEEISKANSCGSKKILREEALKRIEEACRDMEEFRNVSPQVNKAKKILDMYMKNFNWTSNVLKDFSGQKSDVLRQLYLICDNSRNEAIKDMANTASEIKRGAMDPALRHRKRKLLQFINIS